MYVVRCSPSDWLNSVDYSGDTLEFNYSSGEVNSNTYLTG